MITVETWPLIPLAGSLALVILCYAKLSASPKTIPAPSSKLVTKPSSVPSPHLKIPKRETRFESKAMSVENALKNVPASIMMRSGSVFYSGTSAFSQSTDLYILGLNPGGSPLNQNDETVARDLDDWRSLPARWSSYLDESWQGKPPGTHGMQPRMRHMFDKLGRDLRAVPASNVVFVRSTSEATLSAEKSALLSKCWPVHDAVIRDLGIRTILCLGTTAGRWVREAVGANQLIDKFQEQNARGWTSEAHLGSDGRAVVTVTHPGRADWRNPNADPTPLLGAVLAR